MSLCHELPPMVLQVEKTVAGLVRFSKRTFIGRPGDWQALDGKAAHPRVVRELNRLWLQRRYGL